MQTPILLQMGQRIVLRQNIIIKKPTDFLSHSLVSMIAVLSPFKVTHGGAKLLKQYFWIQTTPRVFASVLQSPS